MTDRPHHTARLASGIPLGVGVVWGIDGLSSGGLAPLLVAAGIGALVGAPLAARLWRETGRSDPAFGALTTSARVCATLVAAGVMARVAPDDLAGTALGLGLLGLGALLPRLRTGLAIVFGLTAIAAALTQGEAVPWTLLAPTWSAWQTWLPLAVGTGLLLPAVGTGAWADGEPAVPGHRRGPWLTAGAGIAAMAGTAAVWGQQYEASAGLLVAPVGPLPWLLGLAVAMGWGDRRVWPDGRAFVGLAAAFLWLQSPLGPEASVFWPLLLCLPAVLASLLLAWESSGAHRLSAALPALISIGVLTVAWPGFGPNALAAAAATTPLLLVLWTGGTRLALGRNQ